MPVSKPTKYNHYVTAQYLRGFSDDDAVVVRHRDGNTFPAGVKATGGENHLYSDRNPAAPRIDHVETFLANSVDGPGAAAIDSLLKAKYNSATAWKAMDTFAAWQLVRTPVFFENDESLSEHLFPEFIASRALSRVIEAIREAGEDVPTGAALDDLIAEALEGTRSGPSGS